MGETGGATAGDGEVTEEGKEGDRHPPLVGSPPTFQPWFIFRIKLKTCGTRRLHFKQH